MSKFEQNKATFRDIRRSTPYRAPAFEASTGKLNSDGTINPNSSDGLDPGYVWVRREGDRAETRALAGKVRTDIANIPVIVAQDNLTGELTVMDVRADAAVLRFGGQWAQSMYAQPIGEAFRTVVGGRNFKPGRVKVWILSTLKVNAEAFWYNDTATARVLWEPSDTNVLDLSGNVPAAVAGINYQRWVVIALNPNATTPALVAFNGTAINAASTLLKASIKDIAVTAGYTKLAAVQLRTGDTTEADISDGEWEDLRPFVVDVNYSAITGAVITNSTIDSSVIGGYTPALITGTTVTATAIVVPDGGSALIDAWSQSASGIIRNTAYADTRTPIIALRRTRGTFASQTAVLSGSVLGQFDWHGHDGTVLTTSGRASLLARANQDWSAFAHGTRVEILTTPDGSVTPAIAASFHNDKRLEVLGSVSVNVASPATRLHVAETVTTSPRGIMSSQHNTGSDGARFHMRKSRGTVTAPTIIVTEDILGKLVASGYDGAAYLEMGSISIEAEGTIATNRVPSRFVVAVATDAAPSVLTERFRIDSSGHVIVGKGELSAAPSAGVFRGPDARHVGNWAGTDFTIRAANGTGSGGSGAIVFETAPADVSGVGTITHSATTSANAGTFAAASLTYAHTISNGNDRILVVAVAIRRVVGFSNSVGTVAYGAQSMTFLAGQSTASTAGVRVELWYLVAPAVGTANVVVTLAIDGTNTARFSSIAHSWINVDQGTPFGTAALATSATGLTATVTATSATGEVVIDVMARRADGPEAITESSPQVLIAQQASTNTTPANNAQMGTSYKAGAASVAMTWTWPTTNIMWAHIAVALKPGTNPTPNTMTEQMRIDQDGAVTMTGPLTLTGTPTAITGSRAGNAALANLLTLLDAQGFITDSTTA